MRVSLMFACLAGSCAASLWAADLGSNDAVLSRTPQAEPAAAVSADSLPISTRTTDLFVSLDQVRLPTNLVQTPVRGEDRITRDAAVALALKDSPILKAARQGVEIARGDYVHSSAANNPQANFGGGWLPHVRDIDSPDATKFPNTDVTYLQYVFPTSGRRKWATLSADGRFHAAVAVEKQAELDLILATKSAYSDLQQSMETVAVNEETWRIAHTFTELARLQFKAGGVPLTNVTAAEIAQGQAEQSLIQAHYDVRIKEKALLFQMGERTDRRIAAAEPLDEAPMEGSLDAFQAIAAGHRPEITAALATLKGLTAQVKVAKADRRPDLTVQQAPSDESSNSGGTPFKAFITLPLWDRGQIKGNVIQARANVRQAEHLLEQTRIQVDLDVASAYDLVQTSQGLLAQEAQRILPDTRTLLSRTRLSYMAGAATILDVLYAQQAYRQEHLNEVGYRGDLARRFAGLERAMAAPVPRGPGHPFRDVPDRTDTNPGGMIEGAR